MICDDCKKDGFHRLKCVAPDIWVCSDCGPSHDIPVEGNPVFSVVSTVNFKYYHHNNGNVSAKRVEMFRSRRINRDAGSNGEVVIGKSDKRAVNY